MARQQNPLKRLAVAMNYENELQQFKDIQFRKDWDKDESKRMAMIIRNIMGYSHKYIDKDLIYSIISTEEKFRKHVTEVKKGRDSNQELLSEIDGLKKQIRNLEKKIK